MKLINHFFFNLQNSLDFQYLVKFYFQNRLFYLENKRVSSNESY